MKNNFKESVLQKSNADFFVYFYFVKEKIFMYLKILTRRL
ncbi:hypothetical protein HMPREF0216_01329 [Clostridium celatum DSM 1785]|uniref:Uncharacterized protein n=1 Tax=Clostridium celatum DSM 1785 TaxID=545697 RepID=L1QHM9_9CLOT|nr:hypothetical protein HMPREF0216_01329 [Clostridium celatum DSM 1785]